MFQNHVISDTQPFNQTLLNFDPDSSPQAWEHYKKFYTQKHWKLMEVFNLDALHFHIHFSDFQYQRGHYEKNSKLWLNYITNAPSPRPNTFNRLYAFSTNSTFSSPTGKANHIFGNSEWYLGGETDFNFNNQKHNQLKKLIDNDTSPHLTPKEKQNALHQLEECSKMHHTLCNFSLMLATGNLQGFKGQNRLDRFDTFLSHLEQYFLSLSSSVLSASTPQNKASLIRFLNSFDDIYDYAQKIYFISDENFVDKIIAQGKLPIQTCSDVVRYLNLAQEYWNIKQEYFSSHSPISSQIV